MNQPLARHIPTHAAASFLKTATPSLKLRDEFLAQQQNPRIDPFYRNGAYGSFSVGNTVELLNHHHADNGDPDDHLKGATPSKTTRKRRRSWTATPFHTILRRSVQVVLNKLIG
ncbi:hypothetical protein MMC12_008459 [Toensbergia leucococca]|nr:hypothetical protein [Toensbergia leucococca]